MAQTKIEKIAGIEEQIQQLENQKKRLIQAQKEMRGNCFPPPPPCTPAASVFCFAKQKITCCRCNIARLKGVAEWRYIIYQSKS